MSITNSNITTEPISDFAVGRLDAEDAINHDEIITTAVTDSRPVGSRMNLWLATSTVSAPASRAGRTQAAKLQ